MPLAVNRPVPTVTRPLVVRRATIALTTTTAEGRRIAAPGVARRASSERHLTLPLLMAPLALVIAAAFAINPLGTPGAGSPSAGPAAGAVASTAHMPAAMRASPAPALADLPPAPPAGGTAWPLTEHRAAHVLSGRHDEPLPGGDRAASRVEVPLPPLLAMRPPEEAALAEPVARLAARPPMRPSLAAPPQPSTAPPPAAAPPSAPPTAEARPPAPPPTAGGPSLADAVPAVPPPKAHACHGSVTRLAGGQVAPAASTVTGRLDPHGFGLALAAAARSQLGELVVYSATYRRLAYPMGDVSPLYGVCTDVVVRAYRALGIDLQELVHKSRTGLGDRSIDHRRVDVLRVFLGRHGTSLPVSDIAEDYRPGDIVTYWRPQNRVSNQHVAVVTDLIAPSGRPMIVHNRGWGPQLEDALFVDRITGHYRFTGMRPAPEQAPPPAVAAAGRPTLPQTPAAPVLVQRRAVLTQSSMPGRAADRFAR